MEFKERYTLKLGPYKNHWGYVIEIAQIDDLFVLKAQTPYNSKEISYHYNETSLSRKIDLYNQDRRF